MFARDGFALLLISPTTWFVYFLVAYFITGSACTLGYAATEIAGINTLRLLAVVAGLLAAAVILVNGVLAWRRWRALQDDGVGHGSQPGFSQRVAALLSAASLLGVVWLMTTVLINPVCQGNNL